MTKMAIIRFRGPKTRGTFDHRIRNFALGMLSFCLFFLREGPCFVCATCLSGADLEHLEFGPHMVLMMA